MAIDKLAIVGAGGHGKVVADCARLMGCWSDIIFFDDKSGSEFTFDELLKKKQGELEVFVAIGKNTVREKLFRAVEDRKFTLPVIRHPSSIVAADVEIGAGSVLMAGAIINPDARLGRGCIVNTACSVDHDCNLDDFVHIAPGARLAGTVRVKKRSWIGVGAVVRENTIIGKDVLVGAGAVVVTDIADGKMVMGVPAV